MSFIKKIFLFSLILILLLSIRNSSNAFTGTTGFSVSNVSGKYQDEVTVDINLDTKSDFVSAGLVLEYDTSKLKYTGYQEKNVFKTSAMNIVKDNKETGRIAIGYVADPTNQSQLKNEGNMVSLNFKIISNKPEEIDLKLSCTSLKDDPGNNLKYSIKQGKINIISSTNATTTPSGGANQGNNTGSNSSNNNIDEDDDDDDDEDNDSNKNFGSNNNSHNNNNDNNKDNNNNNGNITNNNNNSGNKGSNSNNNYDFNNIKLPYTGISFKMFILILMFTCIIGVLFYGKYRYFKDI